jgi:hypothetical protein
VARTTASGGGQTRQGGTRGLLVGVVWPGLRVVSRPMVQSARFGSRSRSVGLERQQVCSPAQATHTTAKRKHRIQILNNYTRTMVAAELVDATGKPRQAASKFKLQELSLCNAGSRSFSCLRLSSTRKSSYPAPSPGASSRTAGALRFLVSATSVSSEEEKVCLATLLCGSTPVTFLGRSDSASAGIVLPYWQSRWSVAARLLVRNIASSEVALTRRYCGPMWCGPLASAG